MKKFDALTDYTADELKQELERRKNKRWMPENEEDEKYWYVDRTGYPVSCHWYNDEIDEDSYTYGNVYRTEEEAQFAADKRKALVRMHDWARGYDEGYYHAVKDGDEIQVAHVFFGYDFELAPRVIPSFAFCEDAERFIDTFRDELEKYVFNE